MLIKLELEVDDNAPLNSGVAQNLESTVIEQVTDAIHKLDPRAWVWLIDHVRSINMVK